VALLQQRQAVAAKDISARLRGRPVEPVFRKTVGLPDAAPRLPRAS
jgi:hypothetical protein